MVPPPHSFLASDTSLALIVFLSTRSLPSVPLATKTKNMGLVFACFREDASLPSRSAIRLSPMRGRESARTAENTHIVVYVPSFCHLARRQPLASTLDQLAAYASAKLDTRL